MVSMKHVGIYVHDMEKMTRFYKNVFDMYIIVSNKEDKGDFFDYLADEMDVKVKITKLITEKGKREGFGDMIELIQIINKKDVATNQKKKLVECGVVHICFGVKNIQQISEKVKENGGKVIVKPICRNNGNWLCFLQDPEDNWIEVIQNA